MAISRNNEEMVPLDGQTSSLSLVSTASSTNLETELTEIHQTLITLCDKKILGLDPLPNKSETESLKLALSELRTDLKNALLSPEKLSISLYRQKQQAYLKLAEEHKRLKNTVVKKTIKNKQLGQGFWSKFLPDYLGTQLAVLAALVSGALAIMAIGGVFGTSIIASLLVVSIAGSQALLYFTQEGTSFRKELRVLGQKLDATVWRNFVKNHYGQILGWAFTIAVTMTLTLLIAFPPAGLAALLAATGLPAITLTLLVGIGSLMSCQILIRTINGISNWVKSHVFKNDASTAAPTPQGNKLWQDALPFYLGFPMAILAALAEGALAYGAIVLLVGTGATAAAIAGIIGSIVGLMYFSQDGTSVIKWLTKIGKSMDTQTLGSLKENKWSILETIVKYSLVIGVAAGVAALIAFPPAGIAAGVAATLTAIGLASASLTQVALITFGVTALALNVLTSIFIATSHYIANRIQQKNKLAGPAAAKDENTLTPPAIDTSAVCTPASVKQAAGGSTEAVMGMLDQSTTISNKSKDPSSQSSLIRVEVRSASPPKKVIKPAPLKQSSSSQSYYRAAVESTEQKSRIEHSRIRKQTSNSMRFILFPDPPTTIGSGSSSAKMKTGLTHSERDCGSPKPTLSPSTGIY